jgi:transcriptional regulator with XRE-family HTH domain
MPLSELLAEGLDVYDIGPKIRDLRIGRKLGLVELGRHTGLSAALLSKIERGKMYPTLPTLLRIALVFGVGLDYFFGRDDRTFSVVRERDRMRFPQKAGVSPGSFYFQSLDYSARDRKLNAYLAEFRSVAVDAYELCTDTPVQSSYASPRANWGSTSATRKPHWRREIRSTSIPANNMATGAWGAKRAGRLPL